MTCSRIIAALPRGTCSLAPGDLAKSEMQKSPVLAGPFRDCERLALEGDRPRELDIRKPASQGAKAHCAHSTDAPLHWVMPRPILSTGAGLSWPSGIDWQRRVRRDLKVRAVVVAVISIPIESVFTHPKDDLQRAFLAVDVGEANVGLMK